jgi:predicted glycoside hydrolase/deacetylase ChbG (UPF0249 family)
VEPRLIVNADDYGHDAATSDKILDCFARRAITSATSMVYMRDSERAAQAARDRGLPVGLHLNLTEPFDDPATPPAVRARQARLVRYFAATPSAHWVYNPVVHRGLESAIADQLTAFHRLFGVAPTHVDGHHHIQECPNVVLAGPLEPGTRVRRSYTFMAGEKSATNRAVRAAINALITRRFRSTHYFFDLRWLHPRFCGRGFAERTALARSAAVELMVHPGVADEYALLSGEAWELAMRERPLGSWADL